MKTITEIRFKPAPFKKTEKLVSDLCVGAIYNQGVTENWYIKIGENCCVLLRSGEMFDTRQNDIYTKVLDQGDELLLTGYHKFTPAS